MDAFTENLKRHIADQGRGIGGTYGRQFAPLNGWHPSPSLVFFDDFVQVDEAQPDVKLYDTPSSELYANFSYVNPDTTRKWVIVKSDVSFQSPRSLVIPSSSFGVSAIFDIDGPTSETGYGVSGWVNAYLVRQNLALGETYGLDNLTWNLAQTLLGDVANYAGPFVIASGNESTQCVIDGFVGDDVSVSFAMPYPYMGAPFAGTDIENVDNKTFYGVLLQVIVQATSSPGGTTPLISMDGSVTPGLLTDDGYNLARPFVVQNDIDVVWP